MNHDTIIETSICLRRSLRFALSAGLLYVSLALCGTSEGREGDSSSSAASSDSAAATNGPESDDLRRELDEILAQPAFRRIRHQQMEADKSNEKADLSWLERPFAWLWDLLTGGASALSGLGGSTLR